MEVVHSAAQAVGLNDPHDSSSEEELSTESQGELSPFEQKEPECKTVHWMNPLPGQSMTT